MVPYLRSVLDRVVDLVATGIGNLIVISCGCVLCIIDVMHNTDCLEQHREEEDGYRTRSGTNRNPSVRY